MMGIAIAQRIPKASADNPRTASLADGRGGSSALASAWIMRSSPPGACVASPRLRQSCLTPAPPPESAPHHPRSHTRMRARLDATDWRILKELQANGRISNVELARKVGISPPPCLRRVRALEQAGMINGYFASLDEKSVGFEVIAFATVGLHSQSESDLRLFENRVLAWTLVRECYMLSGESDFLLKCIAPDFTVFQDFVIEELTAAPNVASVKTTLVIRRVKFEPGIPVALARIRL
jgi:DNA-binding Lrp family transcriptional regulator